MEERAETDRVRNIAPAGASGVEDHRSAMEERGKGRVADASGDPAYESHQGRRSPGSGGSSDTHDSLTHADEVNDTTTAPKEMHMVDNQNEVQPRPKPVDGFADTEGAIDVASPDPGNESDLKPLDPEEYAEEQREARSEEHEK